MSALDVITWLFWPYSTVGYIPYVHKHWADLSNRYHVCDECGFVRAAHSLANEVPRDRGSVMVMYNVATNQQPGLGTSLARATLVANVDCGLSSSTSKKRQKLQSKDGGDSETPFVYRTG